MQQTPKRRSRRNQLSSDEPRAIYQARSFDPAVWEEENKAPTQAQAEPFSPTSFEASTPSRWTYEDSCYASNEEMPQTFAYEPNEEAPPVDDSLYAAYRSNDVLGDDSKEPMQEPLYANPVTLSIPSYFAHEEPQSNVPPSDAPIRYAPPATLSSFSSVLTNAQEAQSPLPQSNEQWHDLGVDQNPNAAPSTPFPSNVYTPQKRNQPLETSYAPYQIEDSIPESPSRKKRGAGKVWIFLFLLLLALAAGLFFFKDSAPIKALLPTQTNPSLPEPTPAIQGYDAALSQSISAEAEKNISSISSTVSLDTLCVTDESILMRNQAADGSYEFYLFTAADGKLLAYFDQLEANGMIPMNGGGFYLPKPPYLVAANGSNLINPKSMQDALSQNVIFDPMYHGFSLVQSEDGSTFNYVNASGELINDLWFGVAYPFLGEQTLAFVDTGNEGQNQPYLLYALHEDGTAARVAMELSPSDILGTSCELIYLQNGEVFGFSNFQTPILTSDDVTFYPDCNAAVIKDIATGKYGLFVDGTQLYAFEYDSIAPVPSDLTWKTQTLQTMKITVLSNAAYPQPLAHYFSLQKDDQEQYVALSTTSSCPILLETPSAPKEEILP